MSILLIKFMSIGDAVMSTVAFQMIRTAFPLANISVLTLDATAPIYEYCDFIDKVEIEPTEVFWDKRNYLKITKTVNKWRKEKYDLAVSFHVGKGPNALVRMLKADVKVLPGSGDLKWLASSDGKSFKPGLNHYTQAYPEIAKAAIRSVGGKYDGDIPYSKICISDEESIACDSLLAGFGLKKGGYISLFPGGGVNPGNQVTVKRYPRMAEAVKLFVPNLKGAKIVLLGSETDKEAAGRIREIAGTNQFIDLTGKTTMRQFASVISKSGLLVTTDSSALHIGQACRVPTVATFGPTDPKEFVDPRANVKVIAPVKAKAIYTGKYFGNENDAVRTFDEITPEYVAEITDKAWKEVNEHSAA